jgi:hypothetical protein
MKRFTALALVLGSVAAPAVAERIVVSPSQIHATPLTGAIVGTPMVSGGVEAITIDLSNVEGFSSEGPTLVYSNNPLLGFSTIPSPTIGGITNTWVGADWVVLGAAWTDHVTMTQAGVITTVTYLYHNSSGMTTQSIILGTGPSPPLDGPFTGIEPFVTVVAPSLPAGDLVRLAITGLNVPVSTPSLYIGYEDAFGVGPGTLSTFWVTGGFPLIGASADSVVFWYPATVAYNSAVAGPLVLGGGAGPIAHANLVQSIVMPDPATIGLLAAGGLAVLRRRPARLRAAASGR